jgi:hypothetical protein
VRSAARASEPTASRLEGLSAQSRLRPIVYALSRVAPGRAARVVASVHGDNDHLLGYVVLDQQTGVRAWASLLAERDLSLDDACLLARTNTLQLGFASIRRGSAQCVVVGSGLDGEAHRRAYLDALAPLTEGGALRIVFDGDRDGPRRGIARAGLVASAVAATSAVLRQPRKSSARLTIGEYLPTKLSSEVSSALEHAGMGSRVGGPPGPDGVDALIVGAPIWSLEALRGALVRTKVIVSLGAVRPSAEVERTMQERGVAFIPDTVTACGRFLAPYLVDERGEREDVATVRTGEVVAERLGGLDRSRQHAVAESLRSLVQRLSKFGD